MTMSGLPVLADRAVTAALLARHDQEGPRYTSYPTAVELHEGFDEAAYAERLAAANTRADDPWSLYMHLPFCQERCLYCVCHVLISPEKRRAAPYLEDLRREIELVAGHVPDRRTFAQLHLGGGTPTYFAPAELDALLGFLEERFTAVPGAERAVEVDPKVTTEEHVAVLGARGFNRMSMGVQDFAPAVQEAVQRAQTPEETARLLAAARRSGFRGVNADLIYGLPRQTPEDFERTIETVIELGFDRAAVYGFAFVPWIRTHQKQLPVDELPGRDARYALFSVARERFLAAGYVAIGMDHFAKPDDELAVALREGRLRRNFQGYTTLPGEDVLAFGLSGIGDVDGALVQNQKKLLPYRNAVRAGRLPVMKGVRRTADDRLRAAVIAELMCNLRVDIPAIEERFGIDFRDTFAEDLAELEGSVADGLVEVDAEGIRATDAGTLFVRNLARSFDRYWREKHATSDQPRFSRTV